jgi:hypothetical protein
MRLSYVSRCLVEFCLVALCATGAELTHFCFANSMRRRFGRAARRGGSMESRLFTNNAKGRINEPLQTGVTTPISR